MAVNRVPARRVEGRTETQANSGNRLAAARGFTRRMFFVVPATFEIAETTSDLTARQTKAGIWADVATDELVEKMRVLRDLIVSGKLTDPAADYEIAEIAEIERELAKRDA